METVDRPRIRNFRDLLIWQRGMKLANRIYTLTRGFAKDERFGLTSQMRRAAVSVPSNIAEGFNRRHGKEYKQFLYIALGSLGELETQLRIAQDQGFAADTATEELLQELDEIQRMTRSLINRIEGA